LIELLNRAQNFSLEDQRGRIDTKNLELPEFLLANTLIKSQSLNQNINANFNNTPNLSYHANLILNQHSMNSSKKKNNLIGAFNESTSSLPLTTIKSATSPLIKKSVPKQSNYLEFRSRSPIMIVYDCDDCENLNLINDNNSSKLKSFNGSTSVLNNQSNILMEQNQFVQMSSSPIKLDLNESKASKAHQISYV